MILSIKKINFLILIADIIFRDGHQQKLHAVSESDKVVVVEKLNILLQAALFKDETTPIKGRIPSGWLQPLPGWIKENHADSNKDCINVND